MLEFMIVERTFQYCQKKIKSRSMGGANFSVQNKGERELKDKVIWVVLLRMPVKSRPCSHAP